MIINSISNVNINKINFKNSATVAYPTDYSYQRNNDNPSNAENGSVIVNSVLKLVKKVFDFIIKLIDAITSSTDSQAQQNENSKVQSSNAIAQNAANMEDVVEYNAVVGDFAQQVSQTEVPENQAQVETIDLHQEEILYPDVIEDAQDGAIDSKTLAELNAELEASPLVLEKSYNAWEVSNKIFNKSDAILDPIQDGIIDIFLTKKYKFKPFKKSGIAHNFKISKVETDDSTGTVYFKAQDLSTNKSYRVKTGTDGLVTSIKFRNGSEKLEFNYNYRFINAARIATNRQTQEFTFIGPGVKAFKVKHYNKEPLANSSREPVLVEDFIFDDRENFVYTQKDCTKPESKTDYDKILTFRDGKLYRFTKNYRLIASDMTPQQNCDFKVTENGFVPTTSEDESIFKLRRH